MAFLQRPTRMTDHYQVLGLSPRAGGVAIKTAYRKLAKQFHPDVRGGDEKAARRFREIVCAYEALGDPGARADYDSELARSCSAARRRFWRSAATGAATFVVMTCGFALLVPWKPHQTLSRSQTVEPSVLANNAAIAPIPASRSASITPSSPPVASEAGERRPGLGASALPDSKAQTSEGTTAKPGPVPETPSSEKVASAPSAGMAGEAQRAQERPSPPASTQAGPPRRLAAATPPTIQKREPASWALHRSARFGFALKFPADVFTSISDTGENDDRLLVSGDGQALLRISSGPNGAGVTIDKYRQSLIAQRYAGATLDDAPRRNNWFVLSGALGEEMFYQRVTFSCDRRSVHGWLMVYPASERAFYDAIIEEIHRSYRYDHPPSAQCDDTKPELARF